MEKMIDEVLKDLYELDNSFKEYEKELKEAIKKLLDSRPDTRFDEGFKQRLKADLLLQIDQLKKTKPQSNWRERLAAVCPSLPNWAPSAAVAGLVGVVVITAIFFGWQYYNHQGSFWANAPGKKGETQFTLEPTIQDQIGIDPNTSFVLTTTKDLSEKKVKELVTFEPKVDFTVTKAEAATSWLVSTAYAGELGVQPGFRYLIKTTGPLKENQIYKLSIKDTTEADREYQWAFQVKAPFGVLQTTPGDKKSMVPTNSLVEIVFNRQLPKDAGQYFEIAPKTEGSFEVRDDKLYFRPKGLAAQTLYSVTIRPGLPTNDSGETLDKEYKFMFETGSSDSDEMQDDDFSLVEEILEIPTAKNPAIKIWADDDADEEYSVEIFSIGDDKKYIEAYRQVNNWSLAWTQYAKTRSLKNFKPEEEKKVVGLQTKPVQGDTIHLLEIPQTLPEGYYFFRVKHDNTEQAGWIISSDIAHYFSLTEETGLVWAYDYSKREPLKDATFQLVDQKDQKVVLGTADGEGLLQFSTPAQLRGQLDVPMFIRISSSGKADLALPVNRYSQETLDKGDRYWDYIATDKNIYRTSDLIRYWSVVKGRGISLKDAVLTVGLYQDYPSNDRIDPAAKPIAVEQKTVSGFDSLEGGLEIKGLDPGYYFLVISTGKGEVVSYQGIDVQTYTKPAYQIMVEPSAKAIFVDQNVSFKIKAVFFDGTPLANSKLDYELTYFEPEEGHLQLDVNGEATLNYRPEYEENDDGTNAYPRSLTLNVNPSTAEEGGIWGLGSVEVFGPDMALSGSSKRESSDRYSFEVKANQINLADYQTDSFDVYSQDQLGDPLSGKSVDADLIKVSYENVEKGEYYDYIEKVSRKKYEYERKEEKVESFSGETGKDGEWKFERQLDFSNGVTYQVNLKAKDQNGRHAYEKIFIFDRDYGSAMQFKLAISGGSGGELYNQSFKEGDTVVLSGVLQGDEQPLTSKTLVYRYQSDITKSVVVEGRDYTERFESAFAPSMHYRLVTLLPSGFIESNAQMAAFDLEQRKLEVKLETDKKQYEPGQEMTVKVKVNRPDGRPEKAEVNLAAVDEALFANVGDWSGDILSGLYSPVYGFPLVSYTQYSYKLMADGMGGCFAAGTPVLMADGQEKPIEEVKAGDSIQTFDQVGSGSLQPAVVQSVSQHQVDSYLLVNGHLRVTQEHRLFLNGQWQKAGLIKPGDRLVGNSGQVVPVVSVALVNDPGVTVYNIMVGRYHTYFAGGVFVHNEGKDGRSDFLDVANFSSIKTDQSGEGSLKIKAPDNITAWRLTARAYNPEKLEAGQVSMSVSVSKPFFVDVTLSDTYLVGDEPQVRARVFGREFKPGEPINYQVKSSSLSIDKKSELTDPAAYISLGALPFGEHDLSVTASQGNQRDTVVRHIKVLSGYARQTEMKEYQAKDGLKGLEGSADGYTKLVIVDQEKGRYYPAVSQQVFANSLRSDQLVASHLAAMMMLSYYEPQFPQDDLDLSGYIQTTFNQDTGGNKLGGLSLFPYSDADLGLSAMVAAAASDSVYRRSLKEYFESAIYDQNADIHRTAKALYGLSSIGEPVLAKVKRVMAQPELSIEDKVYLALALAQCGDLEGARQYYDQEIHTQLLFESGQAHHQPPTNLDDQVINQEKLTAVTGVLAAMIGSEDADSLWQYVTTHDPVNDLDTLEEMMMVNLFLSKAETMNPSLSIRTTNWKESIYLDKGANEISLSKNELDSLLIDQVKGEIKIFSIFARPREENDGAGDGRLSIKREYQVDQVTQNSFHEGDMVNVRLTVTIDQSVTTGQYQLQDILPSGLKPATSASGPILYSWEEDRSMRNDCDRVWTPNEINGNVVSFSFDRDYARSRQCQAMTINYPARVVSRGKFQADSPSLRSLVEPGLFRYASQNQIEIK